MILLIILNANIEPFVGQNVVVGLLFPSMPARISSLFKPYSLPHCCPSLSLITIIHCSQQFAGDWASGPLLVIMKVARLCDLTWTFAFLILKWKFTKRHFCHQNTKYTFTNTGLYMILQLKQHQCIMLVYHCVLED